MIAHAILRRKKYPAPPSVATIPVSGVENRSLSIAETSAVVKTTVSNLTQRQPWSSKTLHNSFGVNSVLSQNTVYQFYDTSNATYGSSTWPARVNSANYKLIRMMWTNNAMCLSIADYAKANGMKLILMLIPETLIVPGATMDPSLVTTKLSYIVSHGHGGTVAAFEGVNEPNQARSGSTQPVPDDWVQQSCDYQKLIYDTVQKYPELANVALIGCSLHDGVVTNDNGADYTYLKRGYQTLLAGQTAASVTKYLPYITHQGLHYYSGGKIPDNALDQRLQWISDGLGTIPVWTTETGYTNCLGMREKHKPISELGAAIYMTRVPFLFYERGCNSTRFESLDDPDNTSGTYGGVSYPKTSIEANFGVWRVGTQISDPPTTWSEKPEAGRMRAMLGKLRDDSAPDNWIPPLVGCNVTGGTTDLKYYFTTKYGGATTIWLFRNASAWDLTTFTDTTIAPTTVTVTDSQGARTIQVAGETVWMDLR